MVKTIVIGIDGVSYEWIKRLVDKGNLPTIKKIMNSGSHGILQSTILPGSPIAWSTSYTGNNSGKTGIYGYMKKKKNKYSWSLMNPKSRETSEIWEIATINNLKTVIVGLPFCPPRNINGISIGGEFSGEKKYSNSEETVKELKEKFNYIQVCKPNASYLETKNSMINRFRAAKHLLKKEKCDLFMLGIEHLEFANHKFLVSNPEIIDSLLQDFDRQLQKFLEGEKYEDIIIYSDHGHKKFDKVFNIISWLLKEKYTFLKSKKELNKIKEDKIKEELRIIDRRYSGVKRAKYKLLYHGAKIAKKYFPFIINIMPTARLPSGITDFDEYGFDYKLIDFTKTKAFPYPSAVGNFGGIYINKKSTEVLGNINEEEFETFRNELTKKLLDYKDFSGKKVISRVIKKEDLYKGQFEDEIYDLVIEVADGYCATEENTANPNNILRTEYPVGQHTLGGLFISAGKNILKNKKIDSNIVNIMPTILASLEIPYPKGIDGKPMPIFNKNISIKKQKIYSIPKRNSLNNDSVNEEKLVKQKLRELGYVK